jgi:hypothetical protein
LLGYSAATLDNAPRFDILPRGPQYSKEINPLVFKKARVFGCHERIYESLRNFLQGNHNAALQVILRYEAAVIGI